ncbi:hypothetical protein [Burkholderia sola]
MRTIVRWDTRIPDEHFSLMLPYSRTVDFSFVIRMFEWRQAPIVTMGSLDNDRIG